MLKCLAIFKKIQEAIKQQFNILETAAKVTLSKMNSLGLKIALVHLNVRLANEMLKVGRIKLGCVSGRIPEREYV